LAVEAEDTGIFLNNTVCKALTRKEIDRCWYEPDRNTHLSPEEITERSDLTDSDVTGSR
jgi:hypothetical protein